MFDICFHARIKNNKDTNTDGTYPHGLTHIKKRIKTKKNLGNKNNPLKEGWNGKKANNDIRSKGHPTESCQRTDRSPHFLPKNPEHEG